MQILPPNLTLISYNNLGGEKSLVKLSRSRTFQKVPVYVYIRVSLILTEHLPSDLCLISVNDEFSVLLN